MLHLGNVHGFNSDPLLAVLYFSVGGTEPGDTQSLVTLGKCYIRGIGIGPDLEKGMQLLAQAGVSQARPAST
jgi:TPR repeat protein